jgi:hypothetical protein
MSNEIDIQALRSAKKKVIAAMKAPHSEECHSSLVMYVDNSTYMLAKACNAGIYTTEVVYVGEGLVWIREEYKITTMKLGRYLHKLGVDNTLVKSIVEKQKVLESSTDSYTVLITKDSDVIVEAYEVPLYATDSTSKSCMTGSTSVGIYGDNEELSLFLVYNEYERIVARTLVRDYKDKTGYIRVYSDRNLVSNGVVYKLLEKHGYLQVVDLEGCCLDKVVNDSGNIVCPYLDGDVKGLVVYSSTLLITSGSHDFLGDSTSGIVSGTTCDCCERVVPDDDIQESVSGVAVCSNCISDYYVWFGESLYHENEVTSLNTYITYEGNEYSYIPTSFIA